jgi:hypothetical protein
MVRDHNSPALESAIQDARHTLGCVMKSDGSPGNDADVAVITNRDTGYRWILHRGFATVEFQTPGMLAEQVARDHLNVYLSVRRASRTWSASSRICPVACLATAALRSRRNRTYCPQACKPAAWILDLVAREANGRCSSSENPPRPGQTRLAVRRGIPADQNPRKHFPRERPNRDFGPPPGPGSGTERETPGARRRQAAMLWPWKFPRIWEISRISGFKSRTR